MNVSENLPDDPKEVSSEYLKRRKELRELEDNPAQTGNRMNAVRAEAPRLKAVEEAAYQPSKGKYGIITELLYTGLPYDDDREFLGVIQDIDDRYLTDGERLARQEINRLKGRPVWLKNRLELLRIKAAAKGISLEDVKIDTIKLKPGRKADPKILKRRDIIKKYIHAYQDWFDSSIKEKILDEFDEEEIPFPKDSESFPKSIVIWAEFIKDYPADDWKRVVDKVLDKDRWR